MRNLKRVLLGALVLLLVLVILAFMLENQQAVSLLFLGWSMPQLPVSSIVVLALLSGMLVGPLIAWFLGRFSRRPRKHIV